MTKPQFRNVPPPPGSKAASAYTRFIPREELGPVAAWDPGSLGDGEAGSARPPGLDETGPEAAAPSAADVLHAARQAGYQDGYRDGLVALENFKQTLAAQMSGQAARLVQGLQQRLDALEAQLAGAVTDTAVELARQVVRHELATDPAIVARVAQEAVGLMLASARRVTLTVHPDDAPLVLGDLGPVLEARGVKMVADASLERGGCRVDSELGSVDARIAQRWEQAAAALGSPLPWSDGPEPAP